MRALSKCAGSTLQKPLYKKNQLYKTHIKPFRTLRLTATVRQKSWIFCHVFPGPAHDRVPVHPEHMYARDLKTPGPGYIRDPGYNGCRVYPQPNYARDLGVIGSQVPGLSQAFLGNLGRIWPQSGQKPKISR